MDCGLRYRWGAKPKIPATVDSGRLVAERVGFEPTIRSPHNVFEQTGRLAFCWRVSRLQMSGRTIRARWGRMTGRLRIASRRGRETCGGETLIRLAAHLLGRSHQIKRLAVVGHDIVFRATGHFFLQAVPLDGIEFLLGEQREALGIA